MNPDPAAALDRTVSTVLPGLCRRLEKMATPSARLCAEHLVARCLGISRLKLPLHARHSLTEEQAAWIEAGALRLAGHEPLQYVLGDTEFMGHRFLCDPRALIPRPETERLVEEALRLLPAARAGAHPDVVDVGTGSGCILISMALARPDLRGTGIDASEQALSLAGENARALGVGDRLRFALGHLLDPMAGRKVDLITANLPYVPTADWRKLDRQVRAYEPRSALDGGDDGLDLIRGLIIQATQRLRPGGAILLETGEDQTAPTESLLRTAGFASVATAFDLGGRPRIVIGCTP